MSVYDDRIAAWRVWNAAQKTNISTLTTTMATVSTNTISAQNITDINAAIAAISAAVLVLNGPATKPDA